MSDYEIPNGRGVSATIYNRINAAVRLAATQLAYAIVTSYMAGIEGYAEPVVDIKYCDLQLSAYPQAQAHYLDHAVQEEAERILLEKNWSAVFYLGSNDSHVRLTPLDPIDPPDTEGVADRQERDDDY